MTSGNFNTNSVYWTSQGITTYFEFVWNSTPNISTNKSTINWQLIDRQSPSGQYYYRTVGYRYVKIDGVTVGEANTTFEGHDGDVVLSGSTLVDHNTDGNKTFSVEVGVTIGGTSNACSGTASFTLDRIPRASKINNVLQVTSYIPNTNNNAVSVNFITYSNSFTHKLRVVSGNLDKEFDLGNVQPSLTINFTNAEVNTMLNTLASSTSLLPVGTVTLTTYSGDTELGSDSTSIWWQIGEADSTRPELVNASITLQELNSNIYNLTNGNKFIIGYSSPKVIFTGSATGKYNSTIVGYYLNNTLEMTQGNNNYYYDLPLLLANPFVQARDSRGLMSYGIGVNDDLIISNYFVPSVKDIIAEREDGIGEEVKLNCKIKIWQGNLGAGNNTINKFEFGAVTKGSTFTDSAYHTYSLTGYTSIDGEYIVVTNLPVKLDGSSQDFTQGVEYDFKIRIYDGTSSYEFNNIVNSGTIDDGLVLDSYYKSSTGYKYAINGIVNGNLDDGVQVNGKLYLNRNNTWKEILDLVHPVGEVFITINSSFNPNTAWGGTWVKINAGYFLEATETANEVGTTRSAGLPNITGAMTSLNWDNAVGIYGMGLSGAFIKNETYPRGRVLAEDNYWGAGTNNASLLAFNANQSNSIYGNSTTVQPKSTLCYMWERTA